MKVWEVAALKGGERGPNQANFKHCLRGVPSRSDFELEDPDPSTPKWLFELAIASCTWWLCDDRELTFLSFDHLEADSVNNRKYLMRWCLLLSLDCVKGIDASGTAHVFVGPYRVLHSSNTPQRLSHFFRVPIAVDFSVP